MNLFFAVTALAVFAVLGVVYLVAPTLHRGIVFGHTVDIDFTTSPGGRFILHRYRLVQFALLALLTAVFLVAQLFIRIAPQWSMLALLILYVAAASTVWAWAFSRTRPHAVGAPLVRTANLIVDRRIEAVHLAALLPLALTAVILALVWSRIPPSFPMHWNMAASPNNWVQRWVTGVFGPIGLGVALVIALWVLLRYATPGSSRMRWILPAVAWYVAALNCFLALLPLRANPAALPSVLLYLTPAVMLVICGIAVASHLHQPHTVAAGDGTPDSRWLGGIFYYNSRDSALWVEKRLGIGWTLNLGNPASWFILGGILLLALAGLAAAWFAHR